jgi:ABC transport system ATP-binding/permease protein
LKTAPDDSTQLLSRFLFPPETQYNLLRKLSGGEQRRLYLCTVLMQNPNFLILDEPTNDLDILTLNVLEEYLKAFEGMRAGSSSRQVFHG